jgi:hypothetical protein
MQQVNIAQRGNQSKHLVEISAQIAAGTLISHILNYKLSQEPNDRQHAFRIRRMLKQSIWNSQIIENIPILPNNALLTPVPITWTMSTAGSTCTDAGYIYSDMAIREHTSRMLQRLTNQIRAQNPEFGNTWGLSYIVAKAVGAAVLQLNNNPIVQHNNDDEEEEEE